MFKQFMSTSDDVGPLLARLTLGIVMFPHGAQKLLGWFGGMGYTGTMNFFTGSMGLPWIVAFLVIVIEFFGALGLIAGALARLNALGIGAVMLGAIYTVHAQHGFFMNWAGKKAGEGYEYHILTLGLVLIVLIQGAGKLSIDRWLDTGEF